MLKKDNPSILVVGQGYVGLPLSMAAVNAGFSVTGVDLDEVKISLLRSGISDVEDILDEQIRVGLETRRYKPTTSFTEGANFSVAIITVPTPLRSGSPDLSFIEAAAHSLASLVTLGATVILESTTYPGTTEELMVPILEQGSGLRAGIDFYVGYSPERIDPGNKTWTLMTTPKVISGINPQSLAKVKSFYESLGIVTVPVSGTREAEMTKLLENTFRHVNIALVNELAKFSSQLGVNLWEAIDAATTKPFGFMRFTPGPGVGGHCLPIDPSYLSWAVKDKAGEESRFVSLANEVNSSMPKFVLARAQSVLGRLDLAILGSSVLLLGLAYKPDTGDMRESPANELAHLLEEAGARITAIDDFVSDRFWPEKIRRADTSHDEIFDLAIMITDHSGLDKEWVLAHSRVVLDTRNSLEGENVEKL